MENLNPLRQSNFLDGVHQAEVPLLDQIQQRQARGLVLLGDGHHEAEVRLHELPLGLLALVHQPAQLDAPAGTQRLAGRQLLPSLAPGLDPLGQIDLVVLREQRVLADVGQIETDEILLVPLKPALSPQTVSPHSQQATGDRPPAPPLPGQRMLTIQNSVSASTGHGGPGPATGGSIRPARAGLGRRPGPGSAAPQHDRLAKRRRSTAARRRCVGAGTRSSSSVPPRFRCDRRSSVTMSQCRPSARLRHGTQGPGEVLQRGQQEGQHDVDQRDQAPRGSRRFGTEQLVPALRRAGARSGPRPAPGSRPGVPARWCRGRPAGGRGCGGTRPGSGRSRRPASRPATPPGGATTTRSNRSPRSARGSSAPPSRCRLRIRRPSRPRGSPQSLASPR